MGLWPFLKRSQRASVDSSNIPTIHLVPREFGTCPDVGVFEHSLALDDGRATHHLPPPRVLGCQIRYLGANEAVSSSRVMHAFSDARQATPFCPR